MTARLDERDQQSASKKVIGIRSLTVCRTSSEVDGKKHRENREIKKEKRKRRRKRRRRRKKKKEKRE